METPHTRGTELNERDIELFNDSLERCTSGRRFLDRFYELFVASSTEVAAKFAKGARQVRDTHAAARPRYGGPIR
jgi:hypothetical protein